MRAAFDEALLAKGVAGDATGCDRGKLVVSAAFRKLIIGKAVARFLFGNDVLAYLDAVYADVVTIQVYRSEVIDDAGANREKLIDKKYDGFNRVSKFSQRGAAIFAPYMKMTQKKRHFGGLGKGVR